MRAFLALIDKEWRDARPLTIACAAITLIVTWSYHQWVLRVEGPEATVTLLVPGLIALFAMLLAADLVASDRKSGVLRTLSMLPVPMRRLWLAKVTFFALAVLVFAVWVIDCQVVVMLLKGDVVSAGLTVDRLGEGAFLCGPVLLCAMAILLCSTVGLRSFASVLVGLALAFGARLLLILFDRGLRVALQESETYSAMACGFLLASLVVFVRGRIHAGARWRPAMLGLGVSVSAVLGVLTASAVHADAAMQIDPHAPETMITAHHLSPSGDHLAVLVSKSLDGSNDPNYRTNGVWVVRTDDGELTRLPGRMRYTMGWSDEGLLHFGQWQGPAFFTKATEWIEPGSWKPREPRGNHVYRATSAVSRLQRSAASRENHSIVTSAVSGLSTELAISPHNHPWATADGLTVFYPHIDGEMRVHHLLTGEETVIDCPRQATPPRPNALSDDGRFVTLHEGRAAHVYDLRTGKRRPGPWEDSRWSWLRGAPPSARIHVRGEAGSASVVYELGTDTCIEFELSPRAEGPVEFLSLPSGGFLALVRRDSFVRTIERLAPDGSFERQLFPPER